MQQVGTLEAQQLQAKQDLQTAQAAVRDQSQLLDRQRSNLGQNAQLLDIERLELDISTTTEVCI